MNLLTYVSKNLIGLIFLLLLATPYAHAKKLEQLDVLAVHSYHQEYAWTSSQYEAFKKQLKRNLPEYIANFSTEYLDTKRVLPSTEYQNTFLSNLKTKYKNRIPDLVYVTDDNALKFVHSMKAILQWNVPVIYSGINDIKSKYLKDNPLIAGVYEHKDIKASILLAKRISLETSRIVFLGDGSATDIAIKELIRDSHFETEKSEFVFLQDSLLDEVIEKLNNTADGIVILTTVGGFHDSEGNLLELSAIIKELTNTGRKILVMEDAYLFEGVLGGYVTTGASQGRSAADIAAHIIHGEDITSIKNENQVLSEYILSLPDMQRFGLNVTDHRFDKAKIIHQPAPFLERYPNLVKWLLWIVLILIALLMRVNFKAKQKNQLLNEQYTDKVTGLQNRVRLLSDINTAISPCLTIIDINNFKSINNLYGLKVGDDLLKNLGQKIREKISSQYRVYRVGGNQFGLLTDQKIPPEIIDAYIKRFLNNIQHNHFYIDDLDISLTLTAGISRNGYDMLIPKAEQALQRAKETNKSLFIIENSEENTDQHQKNLLWAQKVNSALNSDRIVPYFQSITHNKTGVKNKYEALVRLIEEDGKVITPYFFLDAAKSTRQYAALTKMMIEKTFSAVSNKAFSVSINMTVDDIRNEKTIKYFKAKLDEYKVANKVIVELIESEGIENYAEVAEFISDIKKLGCQVAIDDFGTGYSNFTHLIHLNVDYLKIDGSIIQNILKDKNAEIVAKAIVHFAGQLGIETIAEFVDSQEILDKVIELGIDYSQGFYLGKPEEHF